MIFWRLPGRLENIVGKQIQNLDEKKQWIHTFGWKTKENVYRRL